MIEEVWLDLRYAARQLRKNPGFTAVVTLVLALAIGGNTAIFSIVRTALAPLAIPHADRTVMVWTEAPSRNWHQFPASMPDFRDWQASGVFSSMGASTDDGFNLRLTDRTERVEGVRVTEDFFKTLAIAPARGRLLGADEIADGHLVVLSDSLWRSTFNANPDVIGQTVVLDGDVSTIIGVLPASFPRFGHEDLYAPLPLDAPNANARGARYLNVIGRIHDGITLAAARERMLEVSRNLAERYASEDGGLVTSLQLVQDAYVQDAQLLSALLVGAVLCALAVACANVASLLMARGVARRKELAIRTALGGGHWRLSRQLLTEHVLLAVMAGAASLIPAWWGVQLITSYHLDELKNIDLARLNTPALLFNFGIALLTGVMCGVVPAWLAWKNDIAATLKNGPRQDGGTIHQRLRGLFVAGQVALTVVLLVGGGLMLRSLLRLASESPGYNADRVLTMKVALSETRYAKPEQQVLFYQRVIERARAVPGVVAASATQEIPTSDNLHVSGLLFEGQPEPRVEDIPLAFRSAVLPDYFHTMQMPLVRGRYFTEADTKDSQPVIAIDEWTAEQYWPRQDPIGRRIKIGRTQPWREIVGVVGIVETPTLVRFLKGRVAQIYLPLTQDPDAHMTLVVRTQGDPSAVTSEMRATVREIDRDQPIFKVQTLQEVRIADRRLVRLVATLLSGFALLALLLATIGLYGTIAYDVGRRTGEFGLRMSLGAPPSSLRSMVLWQGARLMVVGAGVGFVGAYASTRVVASFLYGVPAGDPMTFVTVAVLLGTCGLVASYVPARRATKVDPIVALRSE